ncbi:MAG: prepilin peptidase [Patescibacteria group bacterium]
MPISITLIFVFIFGLAIGSFLNCLIWRLHKKESLGGRSYCPKCKKQISWHDNIPLLSFIILNGKCRHCKQSISRQYPVVELVIGILFATAFANIFFHKQFLDNLFPLFTSNFLLLTFRDWFIISVMAIIFIYDLRWYLILDIITLPACLIVFLLNLNLGFSWQNLFAAGIIGGSFFLIQFLISNGRWIGGGDIRLGLLMGLALGWPNVLVAILIGYLIGSIVGLGLIVSNKKKWNSEVPLGIFLSVSAIIVLFWGKAIINWYFSLIFY